MVFVNDRDDHYNAAIYELNYDDGTENDIVYDYDNLDIIYFTVLYNNENVFFMLPYNAGTIDYNYSQYGLSHISLNGVHVSKKHKVST